ncbi:MAG: hypothetical protein EHM63_00335 [Actinobacteria bacterium]|nr:MAG: hypothetical protein EHM63_00335 [Actinomycetota bacterium]
MRMKRKRKLRVAAVTQPDDYVLPPGTRKSRTKVHHDPSAPPGTSRPMESGLLRGGAGSYPALITYIERSTPLTQARGYSDPENPRNRRVVVNVHRINETLRHPLTVAELASRLGFRFRSDFAACLKAGQQEL